MRDCTALCNEAGKHVATIGFNEAFGLSQIVGVNRKEMEFFCPSKEIAFVAWHDEFDPENGLSKVDIDQAIRRLRLRNIERIVTFSGKVNLIWERSRETQKRIE